jgi:hypothetical protein
MYGRALKPLTDWMVIRYCPDSLITPMQGVILLSIIIFSLILFIRACRRYKATKEDIEYDSHRADLILAIYWLIKELIIFIISKFRRKRK